LNKQNEVEEENKKEIKDKLSAAEVSDSWTSFKSISYKELNFGKIVKNVENMRISGNKAKNKPTIACNFAKHFKNIQTKASVKRGWDANLRSRFTVNSHAFSLTLNCFKF
jgi:hypothetical protein